MAAGSAHGDVKVEVRRLREANLQFLYGKQLGLRHVLR